MKSSKLQVPNSEEISTANPQMARGRILEFGSWSFFGILILTLGIFAGGCNFAPKYSRPSVETPATFKEQATNNAGATNIWQIAQPGDAAARGKWWEIFGDAELNALEEQVAISNQNVVAAFENFLGARAVAREARAQLFPTLVANPSVTRSRQATSASSTFSRNPNITEYALPLDASWQLDLWGRIRNQVRANMFEAQASDADLENTRLSAQAELASDYFQLRAQDSLKRLFDETVAAYRESLNLTKIRFQTGIASDQDVAQAEVQLETAQAEDTNLGILRAQLEHAIAMLVGRAAPAFSIPQRPMETNSFELPGGIPSQLLERRPDIAAAERRVAEANSQISVARAAFFPTITLSASGGFQSMTPEKLVDWPSRVWSIGAGLSETIFDAGLRRATVEQYRAAYERTVAEYRQTVLSAFQQVEDELASLRILEEQIQQQDAAVKSSARYLALAQDRYKLGIDSYLNVITAQTTLLNNRQTLTNLRTQRVSAAVRLIEALGGGWNAADLPSPGKVMSRKQ
jgi:NodT family efflux transporter outer membrane factor (OMF) lipoprotein